MVRHVIRKLALSVVAVVAVLGAIYLLPSAVPGTSNNADGRAVPSPVTSTTMTTPTPGSPSVTVPGLTGPRSSATTESVGVPTPGATAHSARSIGSSATARPPATHPPAVPTSTAGRPAATASRATTRATVVTTVVPGTPGTPDPVRTTNPPKPVVVAPLAPKPPAKKPAAVTSAPAPDFGIPVSIGNATQLVTVRAAAPSSTTGSLEAWQKQSNGRWSVQFGPVTAHLGSEGVGTPSEAHSRTPEGTYGLTEAFGRNANPGTAMPYSQVTVDDWWVSDVSSPMYNTHQICPANSCPFRTAYGENLYNAGPVYDYALVMDVNRWPAKKGGGSAYFLHVTDGGSTAGCVAIDEETLISIMRWMTPSAHPRIAVGIG